MQQKEYGADGINRRSLLGSIGALGAGLTTVSVVKADQSELHLGRVHFIEIKLEHTDAPTEPRVLECDRMSYSTDDGVVALAGAPTDVFRDNSAVVTNGSEYHAPPISLFRNETREIPVKTGYQRLNPEFLALREEYAPPTVTVETADESALVTIDSDSTEVLPGEETRVELDPRPVSTIPDGTDDVVPVVQIRNRGRVDAYGSDDAFVFSLSTEDPLAGPLVRSLREHRTDLLSAFKEDGLLVVPDDGGAL